MRMSGEDMQGRILGILRKRKKPSSAYEVLDVLREGNPKLAPTTVYRALAALVERGRVHRLESLNAYMACRGAKHDVVSICRACGSAVETVSAEITGALSGIARGSGIVPRRYVIEMHGICASCDGAEAAA